jgi:UDP-GlcNAc:undecaprenyl-phosphate/decaprenyl-phosphate GlcNAc-1-phosphate transferase
MIWLCVALIPAAFLISFPATAALVRAGHRWRTFDSAGVPGQVKAARREIPNTGGIAIFWAIAAPILVGMALILPIDASAGADWRNDFSFLPSDLHEHIAGIQGQFPLVLLFLGSLALLHFMGLADDRRPLGPGLKLAIMAASAIAIPVVTTFVPGFSETRLLTFLDPYTGGPWVSIAATALWLLIITNAFNFLDNMDGLSAGIAAIAGACFLIATLVNGQWFIAAVLALLVGACLGFLVFNFPPAKIFMGDGGSLVLGFTLAFLTVRTTFYSTDAGNWYALFMPVIVLAIPLYDFVSVMLLRFSQGRSLFVGDLQHFSHRLADRGLSRRSAVLVIHGLTAVTGISGIALGSLRPWQAALVAVQTALILLILALFERAAPARSSSNH